MIKYYPSKNMLNSTQVIVDSRDTADRKRAEAAIDKIEFGEQTREFNRALRHQVFAQLKLALEAPTEDEQNDHVTAATENLKALLVE